ncbi:16S rRNA (cytosine(967)-C(5))-methyltransferase RsmB [Derxia lacustris]|uniref:16S rRNA (cytosine(967)-C(5))-methyltransferase RsmB n=1 Tax=Derxia lacustris TaxID=764842 RepID=UPI00111C26B9|nr:16S rRNA (cytosine(967)-C(5))-methyltransferase RsmB [Derxia lacustris]
MNPGTLAGQIALAAQISTAVRAGSALPQALAALVVEARLDAAARGAVQDIAYRTMRERGLADGLIDRLASRRPPAELRELLVVALALAVQADAPYAEHTLVDQTVEAAKPGERGFVNAVLRRFLRERAALLDAARQRPEARWNLPRWWLDRLRGAYPERWQAIADAGLLPPPMTLRVNLSQGTRDAYLARLAEAGIGAEALATAPGAIRLQHPVGVAALPGFESGAVSVQDAGAQLAAPLLDPQPGERVLDACAAPGGKTAHLLELADCELLALDIDPERLARVEENLARLGRRAQTRAASADRPADWWDGRPFDRILADVPCTASGIVRRHADIRWLRREADVDQLATLAAGILDALWPLLKPGGRFVFSTCSVFPQEGERQLQRFLDRHPDASVLPAPGQLLPTANTAPAQSDDHDGFYYALLQKRAPSGGE